MKYSDQCDCFCNNYVLLIIFFCNFNFVPGWGICSFSQKNEECWGGGGGIIFIVTLVNELFLK